MNYNKINLMISALSEVQEGDRVNPQSPGTVNTQVIGT